MFVFQQKNQTFLIWAIFYKKWADLNKKWAYLEIWNLTLWKCSRMKFPNCVFFQNPFFLQSQTKVKSTGRLTRPLKIFRWNNRKWVIERPYWSKVKWSFDFYLFLELCKMEKFSIQIIPDPSHKRGMIIRISGTKSKNEDVHP